jgi:hypothetical protein
MRKFVLILLGAALASLSLAQEGARVIVTADGDVTATFVGQSAGYSNDLYLDSPANSLGIIFNNHAANIGDTVDLGNFTAGTELLFRLHVNDTGEDFFSGDADRNADNHAHALLDPNYAPGASALYFEDLIGGPYDYNDLGFSFTNTQGAVPEPASMAALGLGVVAVIRRKRRA